MEDVTKSPVLFSGDNDFDTEMALFPSGVPAGTEKEEGETGTAVEPVSLGRMMEEEEEEEVVPRPRTTVRTLRPRLKRKRVRENKTNWHKKDGCKNCKKFHCPKI